MPLYSPSPRFLERLRTFDPALRVRWSDGQQRFRLERKVQRAKGWPPSTRDTVAAYEDRKALRDGYILVDLIKKDHLTDRVFDVLRQGDIWRRGGADAVADEMDRVAAEEQLQSRRGMMEEVEAAARERYRYMNTVRTVPEHAAHSAPEGGMSINGGM